MEASGKILLVFGKGTDQVSEHVAAVFDDISPSGILLILISQLEIR